MYTSKQKSVIQPELVAKQTTCQDFESGFKFWFFRYDELGHQIYECYKLENLLVKNLVRKQVIMFIMI